MPRRNNRKYSNQNFDINVTPDRIGRVRYIEKIQSNRRYRQRVASGYTVGYEDAWGWFTANHVNLYTADKKFFMGLTIYQLRPMVPALEDKIRRMLESTKELNDKKLRAAKNALKLVKECIAEKEKIGDYRMVAD